MLESLRSDNGPEFMAQAIRDWLKTAGVKTLYIEPGSPWENGYVESFNGKRREELLNREVFETLREAQMTTDSDNPAHQREDRSCRTSACSSALS